MQGAESGGGECHRGGQSGHPDLTVCHKKLWERACSRKRQVSRTQCRLTHCLREQARSHIGFLVGQGLLTRLNQSVNSFTFDKPCLSFATSSQ
ncbi:hypothetical protein DBR26_27410 [Pseudomonas sp. HMWF007]|nr:hypothetical protein DBR26_27410 [Pseudomonas sp. HMWF007]